jgi:uncharacterized repeat protein (TIGR03803 family)
VKNLLSSIAAANRVGLVSLGWIVALALAALASPVRAQTATTISLLPVLTTYANLVPGASGKLYGVTNEGNISNCGLLGCGTVFELSPASGGTWTQTVLHTFSGSDGAFPQSGLVVGPAGSFYGTTYYGGPTYGAGACLGNACGVVFELSRNSQNAWVETVLYSFSGGTDGSNPTALALDPSGNLVGTTAFGGNPACSCGVVFRLARDSSGAWQETTLLAFPGGLGGQVPAGILLDSSGNIFGTAGGGKNTCYAGYCGLVFELSHSATGWKESVLYRFHGSDGAIPNPSLIFDSAGNLYGSTFEGGSGCSSLPGCGTVFRLSIRNGAWSESVIHAFTDQADGNSPVDGLVFDAKGNLYGGTQGADNLAQCNEFEFGACGQIFKLSPHAGGWEVTAEYPTPGWITPVGDLLVDASGTVYGSACDEYYFAGGAVFEIAP